MTGRNKHNPVSKLQGIRKQKTTNNYNTSIISHARSFQTMSLHLLFTLSLLQCRGTGPVLSCILDDIPSYAATLPSSVTHIFQNNHVALYFFNYYKDSSQGLTPSLHSSSDSSASNCLDFRIENIFFLLTGCPRNFTFQVEMHKLSNLAVIHIFPGLSLSWLWLWYWCPVRPIDLWWLHRFIPVEDQRQ